MVVDFHSHSTDIPFQFDEEFRSHGNSVTDDYFASDHEGNGGRDFDDFTVMVYTCLV